MDKYISRVVYNPRIELMSPSSTDFTDSYLNKTTRRNRDLSISAKAFVNVRQTETPHLSALCDNVFDFNYHLARTPTLVYPQFVSLLLPDCYARPGVFVKFAQIYRRRVDRCIHMTQKYYLQREEFSIKLSRR